MSDDIAIRIWRRVDGWTEIDYPGGMARYQKSAEASAFVAGLRVGHRICRERIRVLDVTDVRPIERAPAA
jgi:hypothetical protein